jgi:hypothetical protein
VVVDFDPFVPVHAAETQIDVVLGAVAERPIRTRLEVCERPVWVWWSFWSLEIAWFPCYISVSLLVCRAHKKAHLLPGGLSVGFMRFAAYVVMSVGFSGSGDRERVERDALAPLFRICLPTM